MYYSIDQMDWTHVCVFSQSLVIPEKFQHILRVLNTNIDGRRKIAFAITAIKVSFPHRHGYRLQFCPEWVCVCVDLLCCVCVLICVVFCRGWAGDMLMWCWGKQTSTWPSVPENSLMMRCASVSAEHLIKHPSVHFPSDISHRTEAESWSNMFWGGPVFTGVLLMTGGAGGDHHAESSPVQDPWLVPEQTEGHQRREIQSGTVWGVMKGVLQRWSLAAALSDDVFLHRSSLTVWTTNWEKIWSVWRRSELTAACVTSGGECQRSDTC